MQFNKVRVYFRICKFLKRSENCQFMICVCLLSQIWFLRVAMILKKICTRFGFFVRESSSDPLSPNPSGNPPGPRARRVALGIFKIPSGHRGSRRRFPPKNPNLLYVFQKCPLMCEEFFKIPREIQHIPQNTRNILKRIPSYF